MFILDNMSHNGTKIQLCPSVASFCRLMLVTGRYKAYIPCFSARFQLSPDQELEKVWKSRKFLSLFLYRWKFLNQNSVETFTQLFSGSTSQHNCFKSSQDNVSAVLKLMSGEVGFQVWFQLFITKFPKIPIHFFRVWLHLKYPGLQKPPFSQPFFLGALYAAWPKLRRGGHFEAARKELMKMLKETEPVVFGSSISKYGFFLAKFEGKPLVFLF